MARDQQVRAGDLILSRHNDASVAVEPGTRHHRNQQVDQVRNGNRWRVIAADTQRGRIAAQRLTDSAHVIFEGDYLRERITLGYASTVHSAQGMTVGTSSQHGICWTILSENASRAMAYVGMTRGRDENHVAIYPSVTNEAAGHDRRTSARIHQMRRGTKQAAAHALHAILIGNDDRARTMHTIAARTGRHLLPETVAAMLDRYDQRCAGREQAWQRYTAQNRARQMTYERIIDGQQAAVRKRSRNRGEGYGLEL